jgi:hypothetical protein
MEGIEAEIEHARADARGDLDKLNALVDAR